MAVLSILVSDWLLSREKSEKSPAEVDNGEEMAMISCLFVGTGEKPISVYT